MQHISVSGILTHRRHYILKYPVCHLLFGGVYGLEVKCSASHAKGTGFDPRSVHACFSVIRPTVLIFPSSLHVKDPLLVPELGQSSKISKLNVRHLG